MSGLRGLSDRQAGVLLLFVALSLSMAAGALIVWLFEASVVVFRRRCRDSDRALLNTGLRRVVVAR